MDLKPAVRNRTKLPIEHKWEQISMCLQRLFNQTAVEAVNVACDDLGYATPNFTTAGVFRLHGWATIGSEQKPWSLILKIVKPDSAEKEDPRHHNYWRREARVMESRLLEELPAALGAAKSYLVEAQPDGTIWLWLEHVEGHYAHTQEEFDLIARQLGRFNGAYLTGQALPDQEWICRHWLRSWTTASRMYAPDPAVCADRLRRDVERGIWSWFREFDGRSESRLSSLERLPRVLAHQDLSQMNMLLVRHGSGTDRLVLIDWQFMSISGVGEDLGKLFGVNMSLGVIPPDRYEAFQASLLKAYLAGLKDTGWRGDEAAVRYGYYVSTALRSVWEVPKYLSLAARLAGDPGNPELQERVALLERIIQVQIEMAREGERLEVSCDRSSRS